MPFPVPRHNISYTLSEALKAFGFAFSRPTVSEQAARFEQAFASLIGTQTAVGFTTGSAALYHGIKGAGLEPGDEIVVPEYEFYTVIETLRLCGLKLRFAKVEADSGNVTLDSIRKAATQKTRAVLATHIHGLPCMDIRLIADWCKEKGLILIEDCAHSLGALLDGKAPGSFGDLGIFSFGDGKALVACGGGMTVTSDAGIAQRLREIQSALTIPPQQAERKRFGQSIIKWALSTRIGFACSLFAPAFLASALFRIPLMDRLFPVGGQKIQAAPLSYHWKMTDATAALGLLQLARLDDLNGRRQKNARALYDALKDLDKVRLQSRPAGAVHSELNFWVRSEDREAICRMLISKGVDLRKDYLMFYSDEAPDGLIPQDGFYLPNHPGIDTATSKKIGQLIRYFYAEA